LVQTGEVRNYCENGVVFAFTTELLKKMESARDLSTNWLEKVIITC